MDAPSRTDLENGVLDSATLRQFITAAAGTSIVSRLGQTLTPLSEIEEPTGTHKVPLGAPYIITDDDTYSIPAGVVGALVICVSGGGSGGNAAPALTTASAGSGGGGPGVSVSWLVNPAEIAFVIGAGGAQTPLGSNNTDGDLNYGEKGGDTTATDTVAGLFCRAEGGQPGRAVPAGTNGDAEGGGGGNHDTAIGNLLKLAGDSGGYAFINGVSSACIGGRGGTGADGQAGGKEAMTTGPGNGPGGGAMCRLDATGHQGAAGRDGYAILQFYTEV